MASSPLSRLTVLQEDLLREFFSREQRFFLTGGAALGGFYLGHRETEDLDLFSPPGVDLEDASRVLNESARAVGATLEPVRRFAEFQRWLARRGQETCVVDLVVDRAPQVDLQKVVRGILRLDTLREIAANKLSALIGRSEAKDLVDLQALLGLQQFRLEDAIRDASLKDRGVDPATLAWVLDSIRIGPEAALPGAVDPKELDEFRRDLVARLRGMAFAQTRS